MLQVTLKTDQALQDHSVIHQACGFYLSDKEYRLQN